MSKRTTPPFAGFEWAIAWRYLRARRAEGGVSVMTWISLIGIALAVFALIATMAVRSGFRADFTATILGANAHVTIYETNYTENGVRRGITSYPEMVANVAAVEGVTRVAPIIRGQVMASSTSRTPVLRCSEKHSRICELCRWSPTQNTLQETWMNSTKGSQSVLVLHERLGCVSGIL